MGKGQEGMSKGHVRYRLWTYKGWDGELDREASMR